MTMWQGPTVLSALQVMDNMPHDRVVRPVGGGEWLQTHVADGHEEVLAPLQDSLLRDCLAVFGEQGEVRQPLLQRLLRRALGGGACSSHHHTAARIPRIRHVPEVLCNFSCDWPRMTRVAA